MNDWCMQPFAKPFHANPPFIRKSRFGIQLQSGCGSLLQLQYHALCELHFAGIHVGIPELAPGSSPEYQEQRPTRGVSVNRYKKETDMLPYELRPSTKPCDDPPPIHLSCMAAAIFGSEKACSKNAAGRSGGM